MNYTILQGTRTRNSRAKKIHVYLQVALYAAAGINHFVHPDFYVRIIPPYLPFPYMINILSGFLEIVLALLLVFRATRKMGCYLLIILLILFIPAHVYTIQISNCSTGQFCVPLLLAWLRLIPGQPLLVLWAWFVRDYK